MGYITLVFVFGFVSLWEWFLVVYFVVGLGFFDIYRVCFICVYVFRCVYVYMYVCL